MGCTVVYGLKIELDSNIFDQNTILNSFQQIFLSSFPASLSAIVLFVQTSSRVAKACRGNSLLEEVGKLHIQWRVFILNGE